MFRSLRQQDSEPLGWTNALRARRRDALASDRERRISSPVAGSVHHVTLSHEHPRSGTDRAREGSGRDRQLVVASPRTQDIETMNTEKVSARKTARLETPGSRTAQQRRDLAG